MTTKILGEHVETPVNPDAVIYETSSEALWIVGTDPRTDRPFLIERVQDDESPADRLTYWLDAHEQGFRFHTLTDLRLVRQVITITHEPVTT